MPERWPELTLTEWDDTRVTVHMWTQVVGKLRLALEPRVNHWWQSTLYVSVRGLTTGLIHTPAGGLEIAFDFVDHELVVRTTDGGQRIIALKEQSVASFYAATMQAVADAGVNVEILARPVEVVDVTPFAEDAGHRAYDADAIHRYWHALVQIDRLLGQFRARFIGKASPVHFFWGGFDLATTRFSGRRAPLHPGGAPNCADWVMQEAYSHEVSSCGFWPGGSEEGSFYAYAYPEPPGFATAPATPDAAYYDNALGEFILPYRAVRTAADPDATVLTFLQSTYEAAADNANWDRKALERTQVVGVSSEVVAEVPEGLALSTTLGKIALTATVAASGMAFLDSTIVNVALPHIGADFDASVSQLQWVLTGYLLALASLILLGGALGDRFGRRKVFVIGTIWFAIASALCGAAPNIEVLIVARILQGVGGALLTPGSLAILQASFRASDRPKAVGAWSGLGGVAGAIGPFVGGWLVDGPGWRWAFLINVPIAVIVVVCTLVAVPESRDTHATRGLDVIGAALAVATLGTSTWALTEAGPRGWTDPAVMGMLGGAVLFGAAFVWRMLRAPNPLVPPALFRNRTFTIVNFATALLYAALGVSFFLVAYELQVGAGWSALRAGTALLPVTVIMLVGSSYSGALSARIGPRLQLTIGPIIAAAGLIVLSRIGSDADWTRDVLPGAILFGLGLVTFVAPLTATVMGAADPDHVSVASGVNNAIARAASLASLAVVPVVSGLSAATDAAEVTDAFHTSLFIAAGLAVLASPLCFFGLSAKAVTRRSARTRYCAVDGPPLQPDPALCPPIAVRA